MTPLITRDEVGAVPEVGSTFAGYRIEAAVDGQRGAGRVYVATAPDVEGLTEFPPWLPLALKVFSGRAARSASFERRFVATAGLQARLRHPSVVSIYDVGTSPLPFLAMTFERGPDLGQLIASRQLDDASALTIARRVAGALEAGRAKGLVYRKLLPTRVLVPAADPARAVLGDFGAGRATDVEADVASNVRALAAILFECLTYLPPEGGSRSLTELRPDLPPELEAVIARALDDDPDRRHGSPAELIEAIERAYPRRRSDRVRRSRRPRLRPRRFSAATVALPVVLLGAAALGAIAAPGPKDRTAPARSLNAGALSLRYPADWTRARDVPELPGLRLRDSVALAPPAARGDGTLVAGRIGPGLPAGSREPVELDALQAYRYTGLRPVGTEREWNLYVVPTNSDAFAVACVAPASAQGFMDACERVASTLRLSGEGAVALAPSPRYARGLTRLVSRLDTARRAGRQELGQARTRNQQAVAAERLRSVYRGARRAAAALTAPPGARSVHAEIVGALSSAAQGYASMAVGARGSDPDAWESGRSAALAGERALDESLGSLEALGYRPQR